MNPKQLGALWGGIGLACLLLLFPPQVMLPTLPSMMSVLQTQFTPGASQAIPAPVIRYAFLFAPPPGSAGIDWERFLIPVVAVALLTAGAVLTLRAGPGEAHRVQ